MREFLIKCFDDDWSLLYEQWSEVFHPNSIAFTRLLGTQYGIKVMDTFIYFAHECPGVHICAEGKLSDIVMRQVVNEVLDNLQQLTEQKGEIIEL